MTFIPPTFVDRTTNPNAPPDETNKTPDALQIANYYTSLHPDNILDPESILYKLAVRDYNRKVNSSTRPPIPRWYCGFVNPDTGELSLNLTDAQKRASAGLVTDPIESQLVFQSITEGQYEEDPCLENGPYGSYPYTQCASESDDATIETDGIDYGSSMTTAESLALSAQQEAAPEPEGGAGDGDEANTLSNCFGWC